MPIDPDGDFYAYKAVKEDFTDKHTGKIDNSVGQVVTVRRNMVDDNPDNACSYGLHAGSFNYVRGFAQLGDNIIIVKINPKDVVSVPNHNTTKLRCCRYEVTELCEGLLPQTTYSTECDCVSSNEEEENLCEECGFLEDECECCSDCGYYYCICYEE
jgi:hypothetical protein